VTKGCNGLRIRYHGYLRGFIYVYPISYVIGTVCIYSNLAQVRSQHAVALYLYLVNIDKLRAKTLSIEPFVIVVKAPLL
jgi:hypothetical protein